MRVKILFGAALVSLTLLGNAAHGQSYYTYIVPQLRSSNNILVDGRVIEQAAWGLSNAVPLCWFDERTSPRDWQEWPQPGFDPNDLLAVWQAVWLNDKIYFAVIVNDDVRDQDNYLDPDLSLEEDDAIQIFRSVKNIARPSAWTWPDVTGINALRHSNLDNNIYSQINAAISFTAPQHVTILSPIFFAHTLTSSPFQWSVESHFTIDNTGNYAVGDSVWSEIIYHDADNTMEDNRVVRDMRMTWNTRGTAKDRPLRDPWNWPGKLVMGQNITAKEYLVYESNSEIITDGVLNEKAYAHAQCVAQVSARNADPQVQNLMRSIPHKRDVEEAATQIVESYTRWLYWPNFNDALVTWRAVTDSTRRKLHLAFTVVDDVPDSNNQSAGINIIEDDGLLFMIDLNKNNRREATDFGFTILRSGKIYKYTGFAENYDSLYTGKSVIAKTGKFGPTKNWAAEIEVNLPKAFKPGDTLRIELGYNDADASSIREHQLMWSTVTTGKTPWSDYSNLGRFILTGKQPPTSVAAPRETMPAQFVLSPSYPNPFTAGTNIAFGLFKREHVTINVYDLAGRLVTTLVDRTLVAGDHSVQWNGTDAAQRYVANGVYFVRMSAGAFTQTQKMIFLRGR